MSTRRKVIAGMATVAALAGGAAVAVAGGDKQSEQAVLDGAAKRLGVTADELRSALGAAEDDQLDAAVKAGELTQEQADEIKAHRKQEGTVLGMGGRPGGPGFDHHGGPGGPGHFGPDLMGAAADALGLSERKLFAQLRSGKSLAQIAKAQGKSLDDVRAAVKAAATKRLDADVKAGRITQAQRDEMLEHLDDFIDHFGERPPGGPGRFGHRGGHFGPPPMP